MSEQYVFDALKSTSMETSCTTITPTNCTALMAQRLSGVITPGAGISMIYAIAQTALLLSTQMATKLGTSMAKN